MNPASRSALQALDLDTDDLLGFSGGGGTSGSLIVVHEKGEKQEPPIDGTFVLQLLISEYLSKAKGKSGNHRVLLILTHQNEKHWSQCCGKFGVNLEALKRAGNLAVIDTLALGYDQLTENDIGTGDEDGFAQLANRCMAAIDSLCIPEQQPPASAPTPTQSLLIVIENLTSLFLAHGQNERPTSNASTRNRTADALEFLRMRTHRRDELNTCVATLVKSNILDHSWVTAADAEHGNFMANLLTECLDSTVLDVSPLSTGCSDEIHGTLGLHANNKLYHFKVEDRTVKFVST